MEYPPERRCRESSLEMDNEKLAQLVREYQSTHGPRLDKYLSAFKELDWPGKVIHDAVRGKDGEIHSHQWRLHFRPEKLDQACSALMRHAGALKDCKSFAR